MQIISFKMPCILDRCTLSNENDLYVFTFWKPTKKSVHNDYRIALSENELT